MIYSNVTDSFISEILKYKSWILATWHKRSWTERFTPIFNHLFSFGIHTRKFNEYVCFIALEFPSKQKSENNERSKDQLFESN